MDQLRQIENLLNEGKYQEVLKAVDSVDRRPLSEKQAAHLNILQAEAAFHFGKYDTTEGLKKAIETYRYDSDTAMYAWGKFLLGWQLSVTGNLHTAHEVLQEAYYAYLRCQDVTGSARVLSRMAYAVVYSGDVRAAIEYLERSIELYRMSGKESKRVVVLGNLGAVLCLSGKLTRAWKVLSEIESIIVTFEDKIVLTQSLQLCELHTYRGDMAAARRVLEKCRGLAGNYGREKATYLELLGFVNLVDKDYKEAEKSLNEGLELAQKIAPGSTAVTRKLRLLGDLKICLDNFSVAEKYAKKALAVAERINERAEIAACHRIFAQVENNRNNSEKARQWFDRAMDLFSLILSNYELAVTRYTAALTDVYSTDEQIYLLESADEYFQSENLNHYSELVDKRLGKLRKTSNTTTTSTPKSEPQKKRVRGDCPEIIAASPQMMDILNLARQVADSELNVFLTGPTGSGKDLLARFVHFHSGRTGQFVSINAAAVPDSMVESELFGYRKGAFTGADRDRPGLFEMADNGTFYLNEIADSTTSFQAKLLEVLESREVRRLGENKNRKVNFRLIAATNHDLKERIKQDLLRTDLFHRINECPIELPALKDRTEDISPLVDHFLRTSGFDFRYDGNQEFLDILVSTLSQQEWPGNVRQLRAEINRLLIMSNRDPRTMLDVSRKVAGIENPEQTLLDALEAANGNKSKAARALGIKESTLRYRLKKYQSKQDD